MKCILCKGSLNTSQACWACYKSYSKEQVEAAEALSLPDELEIALKEVVFDADLFSRNPYHVGNARGSRIRLRRVVGKAIEKLKEQDSPRSLV